MRLLMTADAVGGVWTYALDLCAALAQHDISVVLATMGPRPSDAQRAAVELLSHVQLVESDYRLEWMAEPWRDVFAAGDRLMDLADAADVDVIHLNGYSHAALAWRRPVVCVAHSCVTSWWHAVHREQPPAEWDAYRRNVTSGLNNADVVIAPTAAFLETLQSCYGFKRPAQVIRNGRPQNIFHLPAALDRASPNVTHPIVTSREQASAGVTRSIETPLEQAGAGDERPVVTWPEMLAPPSGARLAGGEAGGMQREPILIGCGRLWDLAKNLRVFDAAAAGLPWPAYVIGDAHGPDGQTFVPKGVTALGALSHDDVQSWLHRASIFVHPALYEPFGLAVLEAAAAGCTLVLSDIPTLRELWDGAAEFFNPRDIAQLHSTLTALIADPAKRAALAAAAQRRATEYTAEAMGAAYAKVYRSLAANVPRKTQLNEARAVA